LQAQGRATPLDEIDDISDDAIWYIKAFDLLTSSRTINDGVNRIPIESLFLYSEKIGIIGTLEEFIYIIREMDSVYIKHAEDKIELARKKASKNGK
jgi:hypothetical protein